jgi:uncharacterized RDD family membrane protein YckC
MYCTKCGSTVDGAAAFCGACGQPTGGVPAAQPVAGQPAPVTPSGWPAPTPATPQGYAAVRPGVWYAGFWLRFVAFIIDAILLVFVGSILTFPFGASIGTRDFLHGHRGFNPEEGFALLAALFWVIVIRVVLHWLYFAGLESSAWQGTLGKMALGLQVTDVAGQRISFGRASGRFFGKWISGLILFVGFIMAGFTEKKQALHDMMAGCLVIRKR